jgi:hypothetical protein
MLLNTNGWPGALLVNDRHQAPVSSALSDSALQFVDQFNASAAYEDIADQLDFGFRIPGTDEHLACAQWIFSESSRWGTAHWVNFTIQTVDCHHILTKISTGAPGSDIIVFSAHFDSRAVAEKDLEDAKQLSPILGANDGASGIAVMLELARVITQSNVSWEYEFWFLAIDAEDQGNDGIDSWDWCEGSEWMAADMETNPEHYFDSDQSISSIRAFINLDMVGGENLQFIRETGSNSALLDAIFLAGNELGYVEEFPSSGLAYSVYDDHVPFVNIGIPAADIIIKFWDTDCGWPYHHTSGDNLDHISQTSLDITGRTMLHFLYKNFHPDSPSPTDFSPSWWAENRNPIIWGLGILGVAGLGLGYTLLKKKLDTT